ncbi:hypothetical protein SAY86_024274 [Trapa natans]|uniref:Uncharacterized protein n=1 Tax=Trapa natans TaxID=22666 RepID=A0AAN7M4Z5_TRANT|nr:hypothetical protein SAY86_024274 [Trapa natans]
MTWYYHHEENQIRVSTFNLTEIGKSWNSAENLTTVQGVSTISSWTPICASAAALLMRIMVMVIFGHDQSRRDLTFPPTKNVGFALLTIFPLLLTIPRIMGSHCLRVYTFIYRENTANINIITYLYHYMYSNFLQC